MKFIKKFFKVVITALSYVVFVIGLIAFILVLVSGKKGIPQVFGYSFLTVETGSMEPIYSVGGIVLVKNTDFDTLEIGDDICFYSKDPDILNKPNTHRIYKIEIDENNDKIFVTKGVANSVPDGYTVDKTQLIGKVVGYSAVFGKVFEFMTTGWVIFIALILPLMIIVCTEMVNIKNIVSSGKDTNEADKAKDGK